MSEYHKIQTVYKRDPATKHKTLLIGEYSMPEFEYLATNKWIFTEKVDGTNIRIMWNGEGIVFGGRTDNAQIPAHLVTVLNAQFMTLPKLELMKHVFAESKEVCLYGEGYGAKIQKGGGNYRPDQGFVLFDVKIGGWWLNRDSVMDIAHELSLEIVPIIGYGMLPMMVDKTRIGFKSQWGDFQAEGIVARPAVELLNRGGKRIITKIKFKDFKAANDGRSR